MSNHAGTSWRARFIRAGPYGELAGTDQIVFQSVILSIFYHGSDEPRPPGAPLRFGRLFSIQHDFGG